MGGWVGGGGGGSDRCLNLKHVVHPVFDVCRATFYCPRVICRCYGLRRSPGLAPREVHISPLDPGVTTVNADSIYIRYIS